MKSETQRKTTVRTRAARETRVPAADIAVTPAPAVATAKAEPAAPKLAPTRDAIARRAYELYLARGKADGHHVEDWMQAERELLARYN